MFTDSKIILSAKVHHYGARRWAFKDAFYELGFDSIKHKIQNLGWA